MEEDYRRLPRENAQGGWRRNSGRKKQIGCVRKRKSGAHLIRGARRRKERLSTRRGGERENLNPTAGRQEEYWEKEVLSQCRGD